MSVTVAVTDPPEITEDALSVKLANTGVTSAGWTAKLIALDAPPPGCGFDTITGKAPTELRSAALNVIVI